MSLFDIIGDITEKQIVKTDTGGNRIFGVVVGEIAKNYDKDIPGRVCVTVPIRDDRANELKWARVAMPSGGAGWGHYFLPETGDQVLLAFEQGNIEKPYVIGCIPKDSSKFLAKAADEHNQYKKIMTRNGNTICFEDDKEGEGENDKIHIITARTGHRIELDNEKKYILVSDKDGKNKIEMKTEVGQTTIKTEKKLTIEVGDNITLTMNGSNGTVELKAAKLNVQTNGKIEVTSSGSAKLSAGNFSVESNAMLKLSSSGAVIVQGTPIKLG